VSDTEILDLTSAASSSLAEVLENAFLEFRRDGEPSFLVMRVEAIDQLPELPLRIDVSKDFELNGRLLRDLVSLLAEEPTSDLKQDEDIVCSASCLSLRNLVDKISCASPEDVGFLLYHLSRLGLASEVGRQNHLRGVIAKYAPCPDNIFSSQKPRTLSKIGLIRSADRLHTCILSLPAAAYLLKHDFEKPTEWELVDLLERTCIEAFFHAGSLGPEDCCERLAILLDKTKLDSLNPLSDDLILEHLVGFDKRLLASVLKNQRTLFPALVAATSLMLSRKSDDPSFVESLARRRNSFLIVARTARRIAQIGAQLRDRNFPVFVGDLQRSSDTTKLIAALLAESYACLASAEQQTGSDRYLPSIFSSNLAIVHNHIMELSAHALEKATPLIDFFIKNRSISVLKDIIFEAYGLSGSHVIGRRDFEKVILFILDGLGLVQYYWQSRLIPNNFLSSAPDQILVCSSSPIPETTTAMMSIFTGTDLKEHAIPSRFIYENGRFRKVDLMLGDFRALTKARSFCDELSKKGVNTHSVTQFRTGTNSFQRFAFGDNDGHVHASGERDAFYEAKSLVTSLANGVRDFVYVYVPFIDRRGHPIGPFTNFELYEFQILNLLFYDFVKGIAKARPDLLEKTLIIIAADHGMYEVSSGARVSPEDLIPVLNPAQFAMDGRCCMVQCPAGEELETKQQLNDRLTSLAIAKDTYTITEKRNVDYFGTPGDLCFDRTSAMILQFCGPAQFVPSSAKQKRLLFLGNHGGRSIEEMFVPVLCIPLSNQTIEKIDHIYQEPTVSGT
jgi:hypothetical protein